MGNSVEDGKLISKYREGLERKAPTGAPEGLHMVWELGADDQNADCEEDCGMLGLAEGLKRREDCMARVG